MSVPCARRVRPLYHVFGHIHEGYGMWTDGTTAFINASTCNIKYKAENGPIVFDLPLDRQTALEYPYSLDAVCFLPTVYKCGAVGLIIYPA